MTDGDRDERDRDDTGTPYGSRLLGPLDQSPRTLRRRVQILLTVFLVITNLVGAGLVVFIAGVVTTVPRSSAATDRTTHVWVPVYVVFAVIVGAVIGTVATKRALHWSWSGDPPNDEQRTNTLRAPLRLTFLQFALWAAATVVFTAVALAVQPDRALATALTIGTAAIVVSGIAYLLADFALRPFAALALTRAKLTDRPRGVGIRSRAVIFWLVGTGAPVLSLALGAVLALVNRGASLHRLAIAVISVGVIVLVFGLLVTVLASGAVVDPVLSLRDAMLDVERGDLDRRVVIFDGTEVGLLQAGFNQMAEGLGEREQLRDLFGRHVGKEVAQQAAKTLGKVELGGEKREVSVLFVDLTGSTSYAAEHDPIDVVAVLNRFFGVVVDEVDQRGGLVNKFIGDAVLAVFGAPVELDDHAGRALGAARTIAERLAEEVTEVGAGVGVATGEVVVGNVGHEARFEYTVIGDAVNSAARLTDLAKKVDGRVLASWASVEAADADEAGHWREHDETTLRGRSEPTRTAVPTSADDR